MEGTTFANPENPKVQNGLSFDNFLRHLSLPRLLVALNLLRSVVSTFT